MSLQALGGATGSTVPSTTAAPVIDQALEPASIRHGSPATQQAYKSALAFEQVLVEQLAKSLTATAGLGGEETGEAGGEGGEAAASQLSATLPQSLSASVMNAGGLGMAAQMVQQMQTLGGDGTAAVSPSSGGSGSESSAVTLPSAAAPVAVSAPATSPSSGGTP